jgi:hypothetical protein
MRSCAYRAIFCSRLGREEWGDQRATYIFLMFSRGKAATPWCHPGDSHLWAGLNWAMDYLFIRGWAIFLSPEPQICSVLIVFPKWILLGFLSHFPRSCFFGILAVNDNESLPERRFQISAFLVFDVERVKRCFVKFNAPNWVLNIIRQSHGNARKLLRDINKLMLGDTLLFNYTSDPLRNTSVYLRLASRQKS